MGQLLHLPKALGFVAIMLAASVACAGEIEDGGVKFSAPDLLAGLKGEKFEYRGQILTGDVGVAFAEGFVAATAERLDDDGQWCGLSKILPHELQNRVFDALEAERPAKQANAADAIKSVLVEKFPCN